MNYAAPVALCITYVILAIFGDSGLKVWADGRRWPWLVGAMGVHAAASWAWAAAMKRGFGFGRSAAVLMVANLVGSVLIARFGFQEPLTAKHLAGLGAAVVAIVLLA